MNCNVYGMIDFGDGLVEVRCTDTVPNHTDHICHVLLSVEGQSIPEKAPEGESGETVINHKNVFEEGK